MRITLNLSQAVECELREEGGGRREGLKFINLTMIIAERGEHLPNLLLTSRRVFDSDGS